MDEGDKVLMHEILELSKDNNKMISKLYRSFWWSKFWKGVYWVVVIGLILGGYVAIQPYLSNIKQVYHNLLNGYETVKGVVIPNK